ncbi:MAG: hypothetical protein EBZ77_12930 [Chitinophagia bacterium]|nr:hypothetical protein [Chitinophagia bacterium]
MYGRLEYGVSRSVSLGIALVYDGYNAGFARLYESNGQTYKRHYNDFVKVFSGSLFAAWHFGKLTGSKKLDPFVTLGMGTNNISHSSKPMADSIGSAKEYSSSLFLRAGVRYYVSRRGSLFADLGIDNKAIATVGFSCSLEK